MEKSYDYLYSLKEDNILWGEKPGRIIEKILEFITKGKVLDIGCGDGKNAIFLEKLGFDVLGYDYSYLALNGLKNRFLKNDQPIKGEYKVCDLETNIIIGVFNVLISYGVFHCLRPEIRIALHKKLQENICSGGFVFFTCLTDEIILPEKHGTSGIFLVNKKEIKEIFHGWKILYRHKGIITENHMPIVGEHKHSAEWIIAQKI